MAHLPENAHAVPENVIAASSTPERSHAGQVISPVCPRAPCPQQRTRIQGPGIIPPFVLPADPEIVEGFGEPTAEPPTAPADEVAIQLTFFYK